MLYSQNYQACVRQEEGYCGIEWHPSSRTSPVSFAMVGATTDGQGENTIDGCTATFVNIPGAQAFKAGAGPSYSLVDAFSNGLCGEAWALDGTTAPLGPLRCKL